MGYMTTAGSGVAGRSDSFGQSMGVRVAVITRRSRSASTALWLSLLLPIPGAPATGAVVASVARSRIKNDAGLQGETLAKWGYRLGLIGTFLQLLVLGLAVTAVWFSIEDARLLVASSRANISDSGLELASGSTVATPEFGFLDFRPGGEFTFMLTNDGSTEPVRIRFAKSPTWTLSGPIFEAKRINAPVTAASPAH